MKEFLSVSWCLVMSLLLGPFTVIPVLFMLPSLAKMAEEQGLSQPEVFQAYTHNDTEV